MTLKPVSRPRRKRSTFHCPDCGSPTTVTCTNRITRFVKEFHVNCRNDACGGRYVFSSEPVRIKVPSLAPHPGNTLPGPRRLCSSETKGAPC